MWSWILGHLLGAAGGDPSVGMALGNWMDVITAVVGTFALIAAKTPNVVDDKVAQVLVNIVHFLGANFGQAKNATAPK